MILRLIFLSLLGLFTIPFYAQSSSKDATVPLVATVDTSLGAITLQWPNPAPATIVLKRRKKGLAGNQWTTLHNQTNSSLNTFTDSGLEKGATYEYALRRTTTFSAYGYAHVAILAPLVDIRGKILVFIDSTTADATGTELKLFKDALRGDGWQPVPVKTGPSSSVQSIKSRIVAEYNAAPSQLKAVLLIGEVPIPYSGNSAWDGHTPDHTGAWPCDNYYADINGNWTDVSVNNITPARTANDNVPGDGKFDQSVMPSPAELMVGRIDFRRLNPTTFGATPTELISRYFVKSYRWRMGLYTVDNKALVDDNFGYFGGEAFAANGFRNAYPLVGEANVITGDFLNDTDVNTFLMGYACGAGSYNSAAGVGNSAQFAADSINVVFSNIFGSYHGDWDFETNPLMPSALATKGGILNCSWAGRPHWFMQALASGETIGYCAKETMNAPYNPEYNMPGTFGAGGAHVALLGDPTTRAQIVPPVGAITAQSTCNSVILSWTPSVDNEVLGYHVYRSATLDGPYVRLTAELVNGLTWEDNAPLADTQFYQVKPVRISHTPGGGYFYNAGIGLIHSHIFIGVPVLQPTVSNSLNCLTNTALLLAHVPPSFSGTLQWTGPNGFLANSDSVSVQVQGVYILTATNDLGCSTVGTVNVAGDYFVPTPVLQPSALNCSTLVSELQLPLQPDFLRYQIGGVEYLPGQVVTFNFPGDYTITILNTLNGCTASSSLSVQQDVTPPQISVSGPQVLTCANPEVQLEIFIASGQTISYQITGPQTVLPSLIVQTPGVYTVVAINLLNGCSTVAAIEVTADLETPVISSATVLDASGSTANDGGIDLILPSGNYQFEWSNGANTEDIAQLGPGSYTVTVINLDNGCSTTGVYTVAFTSSISTPDAQPNWEWSLWPNPAHSQGVLQLSGATGPAVVTFWSPEGRLCRREELPAGAAERSLELPLTDWAPGLYRVMVQADGKSAVKNWIILPR